MNTIKKGIDDFFGMLTMDSDKYEGHSYKALMSSSIYDFLSCESKENAYNVFSSFFDIYRIKKEDGKSFVDLLDVMRKYEENASTLTDKQRDHYNHSVNVFLLGLCIYSQNEFMRKAFDNGNYNSGRNRIYMTAHEEFLFCWGIASLFHDIGYPVEIINSQIKKYISFVCDKSGKNYENNPYIGYLDFEKLNCILDSPDAISSNMDKEININKPTDLLAYYLNHSYGLELTAIKEKLDKFLLSMQKHGFVDHGYYSAIILLKWYGRMLRNNEFPTGILYNQILDAACAIYLHNAYYRVLMREPFNLLKMDPFKHPVSFLLIVCDEIQEWKRESYGILNRQTISVTTADVTIDNDLFKIHYKTEKGVFNDSFSVEKENLIETVTDIKAIFRDGLMISTETLTDQYVDEIKESDSQILPRPIIDHIELLAKAIHDEYNLMQKERDPDRELMYPTWESLPDMLKYSNVRQVKAIVEKVNMINCYIADESTGLKPVEAFSENEVELLAKQEHDSWMKERAANGWVFGTEKDIGEKKSPYMVPYDELEEEVKEKDREAVRNIIPLLDRINLHLFRKHE